MKSWFLLILPEIIIGQPIITLIFPEVKPVQFEKSQIKKELIIENENLFLFFVLSEPC